MENISEIKISMKEKIAYAMGDAGCVSLLGLVSALLQKYYTDILYISPKDITLLFLISRIWDIINDPIWGRFIDTRKISKHGYYRNWLLWGCIPLAVSGVLMFLKIPSFTVTGHLIVAYISYILFCTTYTVVNIPYGSLASVMTMDERDRSTLSVFRSVGSGIGGLPSIILASICYVTVTLDDGSQIKQMSYPILIIGVIIIAIISIFFTLYCFKGTKERLNFKEKIKQTKGYTKKIFLSLLKSKAFISICLASLLLISSQMFTQTYYAYLFDYYFNKTELYMLVMVCNYLPIAIIMLFINNIIKKTGKKALCAIGLLVASLANLLLFIIQTHNIWLFLFICLISGFGFNFFILEVWAMVNDVIDHNEIVAGIREEATSYSLFSFTRNMGHTLAGVLSTQALVWIGYQTGKDIIQEPNTIKNMYNLSVLVPAVLFFLGFLTLWFFYPLNKSKMLQLQQQKNELYANLQKTLNP